MTPPGVISQIFEKIERIADDVDIDDDQVGPGVGYGGYSDYTDYSFY